MPFFAFRGLQNLDFRVKYGYGALESAGNVYGYLSLAVFGKIMDKPLLLNWLNKTGFERTLSFVLGSESAMTKKEKVQLSLVYAKTCEHRMPDLAKEILEVAGRYISGSATETEFLEAGVRCHAVADTVKGALDQTYASQARWRGNEKIIDVEEKHSATCSASAVFYANPLAASVSASIVLTCKYAQTPSWRSVVERVEKEQFQILHDFITGENHEAV